MMQNQNTLWIDGVGGYGVYDQSEVVFGGRGSAPEAIEIASDIPKQAFSIRYIGDDYLIQPFHQSKVEVNGKLIVEACVLTNGDEIRIGGSVQLAFAKPSPLSDTAVLRLTSRHRWSESIDGVVLFRRICMLGPSSAAHVNCKYWTANLTLYRQENAWRYRVHSNERASVGASNSFSLPIALNERIQGEDFSITIT
jgi:hypothetical protein